MVKGSQIQEMNISKVIIIDDDEANTQKYINENLKG